MLHLLVFLLALALTHASVAVTQPKSVVSAPYNLNNPIHQLAIDKVTREAQAWYQHTLTSFAENYALLPPASKPAALDKMMSVFCEYPFFDGYIGITPVPVLITNRSYVAELYASFPAPDMTFQVNVHSAVVTIPDSTPSIQLAVHANITSFLSLITSAPGTTTYLGHYQNEWRINAQGYPCISRFHDQVTSAFLADGTRFIYIPWNL